MADGGSRADHRAFALSIAKRHDPGMLMWVGGIVIVFAVINHVSPPRTPTAEFIGLLVIGVGMMGLAWVLARPATQAWLVPWAFALSIVVIVCWLLVMYVNEPIEANLTYVLIAMTGYGPFTFGWRPFAVAGALMLAATTAAMAYVDQPRIIDWIIGIAAAVAVGAVLLLFRMRMLDELSDAETMITALSTKDSLTGLLNRHGLEERLPTMWSEARRRKELVSVCFLDVRGLKLANDEHGHEFGDLVLHDVSEGLRASVRGGDLVARWGGDEFVVAGPGAGVSADALGDRLGDYFETRGRADRGSWSGDVTVGLAVGAAEACSFEDLLQRADDDMYARRRPG